MVEHSVGNHNPKLTFREMFFGRVGYCRLMSRAQSCHPAALYRRFARACSRFVVSHT